MTVNVARSCILWILRIPLSSPLYLHPLKPVFFLGAHFLWMQDYKQRSIPIEQKSNTIFPSRRQLLERFCGFQPDGSGNRYLRLAEDGNAVMVISDPATNTLREVDEDDLVPPTVSTASSSFSSFSSSSTSGQATLESARAGSVPDVGALLSKQPSVLPSTLYQSKKKQIANTFGADSAASSSSAASADEEESSGGVLTAPPIVAIEERPMSKKSSRFMKKLESVTETPSPSSSASSSSAETPMYAATSARRNSVTGSSAAFADAIMSAIDGSSKPPSSSQQGQGSGSFATPSFSSSSSLSSASSAGALLDPGSVGGVEKWAVMSESDPLLAQVEEQLRGI